jgi:hypothetical protein
MRFEKRFKSLLGGRDRGRIEHCPLMEGDSEERIFKLWMFRTRSMPNEFRNATFEA